MEIFVFVKKKTGKILFGRFKRIIIKCKVNENIHMKWTSHYRSADDKMFLSLRYYVDGIIALHELIKKSK